MREHINLTGERLKQLWREKQITAKGYIRLILELERLEQVSNVPEFCQEWEIGQSTYYKAVCRSEKTALVTAITAVDAKLSTTGYRLWLYLCSMAPLPGMLIELPSQAELAGRLEVDVRSIRRAAKEIEDAGLWSFKPETRIGINLSTPNGEEVES